MQAEITEEDYDALKESFEILSDEYGNLLSQLKFTHTLLSLLIEEEGGVVEVSRELADTYDGMKTAINMYEGEDVFIIEVVDREDAE